MFFKKHILKISLVFLLISSGIFCGYTIWNHSNSQSVIETQMGERNMPNGMEKSDSSDSKEMDRGQTPPSMGEGEISSEGQAPSAIDGQKQGLNDSSSEDQGQETPSFGQDEGNQMPNGGGDGNKPPQGQDQESNSNGGSKIKNFMQQRSGGKNDNSGYGASLVIYSIIFFGLAIGAYFIMKYKKIKVDPKNQKLIIFTVLGVGLFLRIALGVLVEGYTTDLNFFKTWATKAANSLSEFYSGSRAADYPPFFIYILCFIGKLTSISSLSGYSTLLIKIPSILADIVTAYIIYKLAKKYISSEMSTLLAVFYIFNPAVFINSALWGQVDSFFTMIIIIAVYLMSENKIILSTVIFTVGVLMKPQGIIYLPILFFEIVRRKDFKLLLKMAAVAIVTALIIIIPFSINQSPLWIFNLYSNTISEYPYASVNGFNFFSLIGANYIKNKSTLFIFSYHTYGMLFIVLVTLFSWYIYAKGNAIKFAPLAALIQIAGVFTFSVGMHERYLFPAAALAVLAYIYQKDKRFLLLAVGFSITIFINTYEILCGNSFLMNGLTYGLTLIMASLLNVLLFGYLAKIGWNLVHNSSQLEDNVKDTINKV
ncbi:MULTISPECIES: glycosyltransferase family 39 protein [Clostridium]|uniref:Glycosyltransferase family 39 protein n=1 Tax=Clostridium cibarium TaxID=2762247 RepID=A0ABR8PVG1_9CLOT|nr:MULTISPECIES: glycosyltransferase family 39 protein [Clostridium]MBD7912156.1 glycosyltransferase family 39 protein [Clostridium cibarium]